MMSAVHYAVNQRTARFFRQYKELIEQRYNNYVTNQFAKDVAGDLAKRGKIKRERAFSVISAIIREFEYLHPSSAVIRRDSIVTTSKLSNNFEPAIAVMAGLSGGHLKGDHRHLEVFQVQVQSARVSKQCVEMIDCASGVQLNFHAIARLDEREIDKNPVYGLAEQLNDILIYTTLFQCVCNPTIGLNFTIPYNGHMLLGTVGVMRIPKGYHQQYIRLHCSEKPYHTEIGTPQEAPLIEIRTAVSYNELTEQQDQLHDALVEFANDNIDDINMLFEGLFSSKFVAFDVNDAQAALDRLRYNFEKISRMPAWIRHQQNKGE